MAGSSSLICDSNQIALELLFPPFCLEQFERDSFLNFSLGYFSALEKDLAKVARLLAPDVIVSEVRFKGGKWWSWYDDSIKKLRGAIASVFNLKQAPYYTAVIPVGRRALPKKSYPFVDEAIFQVKANDFSYDLAASLLTCSNCGILLEIWGAPTERAVKDLVQILLKKHFKTVVISLFLKPFKFKSGFLAYCLESVLGSSYVKELVRFRRIITKSLKEAGYKEAPLWNFRKRYHPLVNFAGKTVRIGAGAEGFLLGKDGRFYSYQAPLDAEDYMSQLRRQRQTFLAPIDDLTHLANLIIKEEIDNTGCIPLHIYEQFFAKRLGALKPGLCAALESHNYLAQLGRKVCFTHKGVVVKDNLFELFKLSCSNSDRIRENSPLQITL